MYRIDFYKDENGESELLDFIRGLLLSSGTNKDARIQYDKIYSQIGLLREKGTSLPAKYTKHIDEDIWELRPGKNRYYISAGLMICLCCCIISARRLTRLPVRK